MRNDSGGTNISDTYAGFTLTAGEWAYVALNTDDAGDVRIRHNQNESTSLGTAGTHYTNFNKPLTIGVHNSGSYTQYFAGEIGEVLHYTKSVGGTQNYSAGVDSGRYV